MLEPLNRTQLFDALRPPIGYDVDMAIGTTFCLDLMTLLTVPLAFALFDWEDEDGRINSDPTALLEASRRYADRIHFFCHSGQTYLPSRRSPLFYQLESIVHEVLPPNDHGVFHPKVWILRLTPEAKDQPIRYRLLCSSRNLTFDRSWDTLLVLDGERTDRELAISSNHPLGDFIQALPKMMVIPPSDELRKIINRVHQEIRLVRFDKPEGFEDIKFHALGLPNAGKWSFGSRCDQALAMAPFVDEDFVKQLKSTSGGRLFLISRLEELQQLNPDFIGDCRKVFYLDPDADEPVSDETQDNEKPVSSKEADCQPTDAALSGLHAKLYITDTGWNSSVWTGSPNATTAAFNRNVEFLVQLTGKKSMCGVDVFLTRTKGEHKFVDLLRDFNLDENPVAVKNDDAHKAEYLTDHVRRLLSELQLLAKIITLDVETYNIGVESNKKIQILLKKDEIASVMVWPLTISDRNAISAQTLFEGGRVEFPNLSFESLTTFFAFHVKVVVGKCSHEVRFVMNLQVEGLPTDRAERLLKIILHNKNQVLRMLFLLLGDPSNDLLSRSYESVRFQNNSDDSVSLPPSDFPLFESLLKTLERHPKNLERVAKLVEDLAKTEGGIELFPPGFLQAWEPIWLVAQQTNNEDNRT